MATQLPKWQPHYTKHNYYAPLYLNVYTVGSLQTLSSKQYAVQ